MLLLLSYFLNIQCFWNFLEKLLVGWIHHFSPMWLASNVAPCWQREQRPTPSPHDQKTAIRVSLGSAIRTSKHSKSAIRGRFHNRSVIRRFCKIRESVQFFNEIRESVAILGQIRRSASLFTPPPTIKIDKFTVNWNRNQSLFLSLVLDLSRRYMLFFYI